MADPDTGLSPATTVSAVRLAAITAFVERADRRAEQMADAAQKHYDRAATAQRYTEHAAARVTGQRLPR